MNANEIIQLYKSGKQTIFRQKSMAVLVEEIERLRKENTKLAVAVYYYAQPLIYEPGNIPIELGTASRSIGYYIQPLVITDKGETAKRALDEAYKK